MKIHTLLCSQQQYLIQTWYGNSKCPSTYERIKEMWYTHNRIVICHEKNEILSFSMKNMDGLGGSMHSEISLTKTTTSQCHICKSKK